MTGIAIMQLRDRGRLSSTTRPSGTFPNSGSTIRTATGAQVTVRHLISHSAGFRGGTWPWGGDQPWHPFEPRAGLSWTRCCPYTEVRFEPGSKYSYSNPGIVYLGRIIELLSGEDFEVYIAKNILRPLGMRDSYFDRAPYHSRPPVAQL